MYLVARPLSVTLRVERETVGKAPFPTGAVMSQFWAVRLRIWGLLCGSCGPGG